MKKIISILMLAVICVLFISALSSAADNVNYYIKVKIVGSNVSITIPSSGNETVDLGYVVEGSSVVTGGSGRTITRNNGTAQVTLKLKITGKPTGWTVQTSSLGPTGVNQFCLATVFETWNQTIQFSDFEDNDIITETDKTCGDASNGTFATSGTASDEDGYQITPGKEVSNFYFFNAPTSLSDTDQYYQEQTITITATAFEDH